VGAVAGAVVAGGCTVGGAEVGGTLTGGDIGIVGASCAKAAGVVRTRNAAIALVAGRRRGAFFVIVKDKRTAREKRCQKALDSTMSRADQAAR